VFDGNNLRTTVRVKFCLVADYKHRYKFYVIILIFIRLYSLSGNCLLLEVYSSCHFEQYYAKLEVLTAVRMTMLLFLVVTPCRLAPTCLHGVTTKENIVKTRGREPFHVGRPH
jgi:hypothetical protein